MNEPGGRNIDTTIADCEQRLYYSPNDCDVLYELGHAYFTKERYADAERCFKLICSLQPEDHESFNACGKAMLALGNSLQATTQFKRAIDLWTEEPKYYADLGDSLVALKRIDEARKCYQTGFALALPIEEVRFRIAEAMESIARLGY